VLPLPPHSQNITRINVEPKEPRIQDTMKLSCENVAITAAAAGETLLMVSKDIIKSRGENERLRKRNVTLQRVQRRKSC
jgi:hypothetical protein